MPKTLDSIGIRPRPDFRQFRKALLRDKPDYVPFYELFADTSVMEALLGRPVRSRADTIEFYFRAGYDYVPAWPGLAMRTGSLVDRRPGYPISDRASFDRYPWPDPADITFSEFDEVAPELPAGMRIVGQTGGILEMAEGLCGYEALCLLLADDRGLVGDLFARIGRLYERLYEGMASHPKVGAVVISDDLGFKTQTLIPPADLREFVFPWHRRLAAIIHAHGKPCILHSCGNLREVMDDLIGDVGIDAKHSFEDAIQTAAEAKALYGARIAILGGFDVDRLCRGSESGIRAGVDALLELGRDGGYCLGTGNSVAGYVPLDHYLTLLEQGWKRR